MKALKIVGIALGVLVLLAVGGLAYVVYKARHLEDSHDLQAQVDEVARRAVEEGGIPALAVVVEKDGQRYFQTYGTAEALPGRDAVYEIGSVTKLFTALTAQSLVHAGTLTWDDHVADLLPPEHRPSQDDGTTLAHLASHTSGLPRLSPTFLQSIVDTCDPYAALTRDTVFAHYARQEGKSAPGGDAEYSNWGMGLLGHLLELASDTGYEDLVRQHLLRPLAMHSTFIAERPGEDPPAYVEGHDEEGRPTCPWEFGALQGAGAFHSTITDMARFLHAAIEASPVPGIDWEASFRKRAAYAGNAMGVCLGWHLDTFTGLLFGMPRILWHNGGTGGFSSYLGLSPERRIGVVVLANKGGAHAVVDKLGVDILMRANHISFAREGDR